MDCGVAAPMLLLFPILIQGYEKKWELFTCKLCYILHMLYYAYTLHDAILCLYSACSLRSDCFPHAEVWRIFLFRNETEPFTFELKQQTM